MIASKMLVIRKVTVTIPMQYQIKRRWKLERRWRGLTWLAAGSALPLGGLCLLNWLWFSNPFLGGYTNDHWEGGSLWVGLAGLLIAPSRGVLVYTPALLLVPFGWAKKGTQLFSAAEK
ncbi:MAG TPA: hypothetical protein VH164_04605, partial [Ktedonobacteraceae bacterium]|nr:hypothetical protein [Ktedonobacteraceae bacterium]